MKNLKKVLSLVLACASALSVMAGATFSDSADIKATEAVDMLSQLGVIAGYEDGSYKPSATVTRAEMAKMIFVARTGASDAASYANIKTTFKDITGHWAAGYIKYCQANGIIAGKSATKFDPDATVTGTEAAKMLLITMGYTADKAALVGSSWANNTLNLASDNNLLDDVDADVSAALPRQYAAQVIYNTLNAYRVKWSTDSNSFDYFATSNGVKETVGKKFLGLSTYVGTMTDVDGSNLDLRIATTSDVNETNAATVVVGNTPSFTNLKKDYSGLIGERVKVMIKDGKSSDVLGVYATSDNVVYTANASAVEDDSAKIKFGGKSYNLDTVNTSYVDAAMVYYTDITGVTSKAILKSSSVASNTDGAAIFANGSYKHGFADLDNVADSIKFVDSDNNNKIDTAIITAKRAGDVSYVSSSKVLVTGTSKQYDPKADVVASGLTTDDWAVISYNRFKDAPQIDKADVTSGSMTAWKTGSTDHQVADAAWKGKNQTDYKYNKYKIDGTWYNEAMSYDTAFNSTWNDIATVNPTCTVSAVIVGGVVYKIKRTSTSAAGTLSDVALVVKGGSNVSGDQVKLQFFDDTTKTVDIDSDSTYNIKTPGSATYMAAGTVWEYSKQSSGEYQFTDIDFGSDYYGDYTALTPATMTSTSTACGYSIADSADVILYSANDSKVITGKQFKGMAFSNISNTTPIAAFKADVDGLDKIGALAVQVTNLTGFSSTNDHYGYIVTGAAKASSNSVVFTMWNGTANVEVTVTGTTATGDYQKGYAVGYKNLDSNNSISKDDVDVLSASEITQTAITGVTDAKDKITAQANVVTTVAGTTIAAGTELKIVSSTKVLYIDSDADNDTDIGIASGTVKKADEVSGSKVVNALIVGSTSDNEIELLIVDVTNDITPAAY